MGLRAMPGVWATRLISTLTGHPDKTKSLGEGAIVRGISPSTGTFFTEEKRFAKQEVDSAGRAVGRA